MLSIATVRIDSIAISGSPANIPDNNANEFRVSVRFGSKLVLSRATVTATGKASESLSFNESLRLVVDRSDKHSFLTVNLLYSGSIVASFQLPVLPSDGSAVALKGPMQKMLNTSSSSFKASIVGEVKTTAGFKHQTWSDINGSPDNDGAASLLAEAFTFQHSLSASDEQAVDLKAIAAVLQSGSKQHPLGKSVNGGLGALAAALQLVASQQAQISALESRLATTSKQSAGLEQHQTLMRALQAKYDAQASELQTQNEIVTMQAQHMQQQHQPLATDQLKVLEATRAELQHSRTIIDSLTRQLAAVSLAGPSPGSIGDANTELELSQCRAEAAEALVKALCSVGNDPAALLRVTQAAFKAVPVRADEISRLRAELGEAKHMLVQLLLNKAATGADLASIEEEDPFANDDVLARARRALLAAPAPGIGASASGSGSSDRQLLVAAQREIGELQADLDAANANVQELETKVQQAAEYVQYQDSVIEGLKADLEDLRAQQSTLVSASNTTADSTTSNANGASDHGVLAEYQEKLLKAADYIRYQQQQLEEAQVEIERLQSLASAPPLPSQPPLPPLPPLSPPPASLTEDEELSTPRDSFHSAAAAGVMTPMTRLGSLSQHMETAMEGIAERVDELEQELATERQISQKLQVQLTNCQQRLENATKDAEALQLQVQLLEEKLAQGAEFVAYQQEQLAANEVELASLREQIATSAMTDNGDNETRLTAELAEVREMLAECEGKLSEGAEFVAYLQQQQEESTAEADRVKAEKADLEKQVAELEEKLAQGAEFVAYQQEQMAVLEAERDALRQQQQLQVSLSSLSTAADTAELSQKIVELEEKLVQGAEFVAYQQEQITTLEAERDALRQQQLESSSSLSAAAELNQKIVELEEKLVQGAEFVAYQQEQIAALEAQLDSAAISNDSSAKSEIAELRQKLFLQEAAQQTAEAQLSLLEQKVLQGAEYVAYLQQQQEESTAEADRIKAERADLEKRVVELEEKLAQGAEFVAYQQEQMAVLEAERDALRQQQQLQSAAADTAELSQKIVELEEKLVQGAEFVAYQQEQLAIKELELAANASTQQRVVELEAETQSLLEKLKQGADFVAYLQQQQEEFTTTKAALEEKLAQGAEFVAYQQEQITSLEGEIAVLKSQSSSNATNVQRIADLEAEVASLSLKLQQGAEFVAYQQEQITTLEAERDALRQQQQLQESSSSLSAAADTAELSQKIVELEEKLLQGAEYVAYLQQQQEESTAEADRIKAEKADLEKRVVELEEKLAQGAEFVAYQQEQMAVLEAERDALRQQQQLQSAAADTAELSQKIVELEEKLVQGAEFVAYQQEQLAAAHEEITRMKEEAVAAAKAKALLSAPQSNVPTGPSAELVAAKQQIASLQGSLDAKDFEVTQLRATVDQLKSSSLASTSAQSELVAAQSQLAGLKQRLEQSKDELEKLKVAQKEKETKLAQAAKFIDYQKQQLAEHDAQLASKDVEVSKLKEAVLAADERLASRDRDVHELQQTLRVNGVDMTAMKEMISSLQAAITDRDNILAELIETKMMLANVQAEHEQCAHNIRDLKKKLMLASTTSPASANGSSTAAASSNTRASTSSAGTASTAAAAGTGRSSLGFLRR